jgi:SAM-dependent methyltransferase
VPLKPHTPFSFEKLPEDMTILGDALRNALSGVQECGSGHDEKRILNLACGRADETAVLADVFGGGADRLEIVGADIRSAEIEEARKRWATVNSSEIQTRFHVEDGHRFLASMSSRDRFDLAFMRHQNFWNDPGLWGRMFDGALRQLNDDGLFVITSYFDKEHELACRHLAKLGAVKVAEYRNPRSRLLRDAPGKSIDRHIAVFRRQVPS